MQKVLYLFIFIFYARDTHAYSFLTFFHLGMATWTRVLFHNNNLLYIQPQTERYSENRLLAQKMLCCRLSVHINVWNRDCCLCL